MTNANHIFHLNDRIEKISFLVLEYSTEDTYTEPSPKPNKIIITDFIPHVRYMYC